MSKPPKPPAPPGNGPPSKGRTRRHAGASASPAGTRRAGSAVRRLGGNADTEDDPAASRALKVRVETAKGRRLSSSRWLQRQLNDPYVAAAKKAGYRSRAAFKLIDLDDRFHLIRSGGAVIDLGAAPGGWTQVAVERAGADRVVGIDLVAVDPVPGAILKELDFLDPEAPGILRSLIDGPVHTVLSDMAAPATGHRTTDHLRIVALCEAAHAFARDVLEPGGTFCAKVLQGGATGSLLAALKEDFAAVRHAKPGASRSDSSEMYVVAQGFKGARSLVEDGPTAPDAD